MTNNSAAYKTKYDPIILKELVLDVGISQTTIAGVLGISRPGVNLMLNRGYMPVNHQNPKETVEGMLKTFPRAMQWLVDRQLALKDVWNTLGKELRKASPTGTQHRMWATRRQPAMVPGNPDQIITKEVEMIKQEAMKHFKFFRNPFIDDVQKDADIYMSDEHRYIEAAMIDAARHTGFLAVIGEVGSGKTVIRRKVVEQLKKDGNMIILFPQMIDKTRVNAASICDAMIMDLSDQPPKMRLEQKTRQVHQLLLERAKQGFRSVLIIEEAHDLHMNTLKYLKRIQELEDGYRKLLGIILIGQTELNDIFDEGTHIEMREVIQRIQTAEIRGLNGNIKDYLTLKFKRVGARADDIFEAAALKMLSERLKTKDKNNKSISRAYPLTVNNYAARAINMAYEMGEAKVTEAVIAAI